MDVIKYLRSLMDMAWKMEVRFIMTRHEIIQVLSVMELLAMHNILVAPHQWI
jgi:hypothetical protein